MTKERIVELFYQNVKGKRVDTRGTNSRHDGREGQWLERQFGIQANANNAPDLDGYELKNETTSKTTFGDWSANRYIYKSGEYVGCFAGTTNPQRQNSFCTIFGSPNPDKEDRCSWSGTPCPKVQYWNEYGQKLFVRENNDIVAIYSYSKDARVDKAHIVPQDLQRDNVVLAHWFGEYSPTTRRCDKCLKHKLEDKFNQSGWFTCKKGADGCYQEICFGEPITFINWIQLVKNGTVFFDSGMYCGNDRPYSQWRANNSFWDSLIVERH